MGYFYFDESIQEKGSFIIGAFVYSPDDLNAVIFSAIENVGLRPKKDEFKSSAKMIENNKQYRLRDALKSMLRKVKIGFVVIPVSQRNKLGNESIKCLKKILSANQLALTRFTLMRA